MEDQGIERTLVMIKPDGMEHFREILERLDQLKKIEFIVSSHYHYAPKDQIESMYREHKGKDFYDWLVDSLAGKPVNVAVYEGEDVVRKVRELCGPTDPAEAREKYPDSLRALSDDDLATSRKEKRAVNNVIHCSNNREAAEYEIGVWFPNLC